MHARVLTVADGVDSVSFGVTMSNASTRSTQPPREASMVGAYRRGFRMRTTRAGTWFPAFGPDEEPAGLLLVHPAVEVGALQRTVARLAALDLVGALPMLPQLIEQAGRNWLVTTMAATPTLAGLLDDGDHRTPGNAAALLSDIAVTLAEVHAADLAHGMVGPEAVVIGPAGTAMLTDWAIDDQPGPDSDIAAWTELARLVAERWCADSVTDAAALARAVHAAEQFGPDGGLDSAVDQLRELATYADRAVLADAAAAASPAPARRRRDATRTPTAQPPAEELNPPPGEDEDEDADEDEDDVEYVPAEAPARELPLPPRALATPSGEPRRSAGFATRWPVLLAALLALVLVGVAALIIRPFGAEQKPAAATPTGPMQIRAVVAAAELRSSVCLVLATITTNGQPGRVVYRWVGENGSQAVTTVSTSAYGYQVEVGMVWSPSSPPLPGSSITLQILEPNPSTTSALVPIGCI